MIKEYYLVVGRYQETLIQDWERIRIRYLASERKFRIDDKYRSEIGRAKRMKYEQDQPRI